MLLAHQLWMVASLFSAQRPIAQASSVTEEVCVARRRTIMHIEKNNLNFKKQRIPRVCRNPCWRKNILDAWYLVRFFFVCIYAGSFCTATTVQDVDWTRRVCAAVAAPCLDGVLS